MSSKSIFSKLIGDTKVGKWLYGDNTYTDGYGTVRKDAVYDKSFDDYVSDLEKYIATTGLASGVTTAIAPNPVTASIYAVVMF